MLGLTDATGLWVHGAFSLEYRQFSVAFPSENLVLKMLELCNTGSFLVVVVEASAPGTQWRATLAIASTLSLVCGSGIDGW